MPKFNGLIDGHKDEVQGDLRDDLPLQKDTLITGMKRVLESLSDSSWWLLNDLCKLGPAVRRRR